jgi:uncharacterized protein
MPSSADPNGNGGEPAGESRRRVERCEEILRGFGFRRFRIHAHGAAARIEAGPEEIPRLFEAEVADGIHDGFRKHGFLYVSIDLKGYRAGPMDGGGLVGGPPDPELL